MDTGIAPKRGRGRPPKQRDGFSDTREALLRTGVEILTEKGFSATGIDEILRRVGVPKGSFYHYFDSKEAFGSELIDRYAAYFAHKLDRFLLDDSRSPLERIDGFIANARQGMARHRYERGCLVGNLGQEMGALPEAFRARLMQVFTDWQARFEACLLAARAAGEIPADADCARLAACFWIGWEGAVLRAKLERDPAALDLFADYFLSGLRR